MNTKSLFDFTEVETPTKEAKKKELNGLTPLQLKIQTNIRFQTKLKKESLNEVLFELPLPNESLHIISNGSFDYFNIIPRILELSNGVSKEFYFSTWTMSHQNVISILDLFDNGLIGSIHALTGDYMRTRESAVYHILELGIKERKQFIFANKNHAKVTLLNIEDNYYTIEGSANFTANPRIEQFIITNHQDLFYFHKNWMDTLLKKI